jgi:uncharacterized protein involved in response to NO
MKKRVATSKQSSTTNEQSSNWKLAIILVSIFLSFIAGIIIYAVKSSSLSLNDRKTSKIVLITIGIIDMVILIVFIIAAVTTSHVPHYV